MCISGYCWQTSMIITQDNFYHHSSFSVISMSIVFMCDHCLVVENITPTPGCKEIVNKNKSDAVK